MKSTNYMTSDISYKKHRDHRENTSVWISRPPISIPLCESLRRATALEASRTRLEGPLTQTATPPPVPIQGSFLDAWGSNASVDSISGSCPGTVAACPRLDTRYICWSWALVSTGRGGGVTFDDDIVLTSEGGEEDLSWYGDIEVDEERQDKVGVGGVMRSLNIWWISGRIMVTSQLGIRGTASGSQRQVT